MKNNIVKMAKGFTSEFIRGWSYVAKVSCILCHRGVQLILAYSWARLAILIAGKGTGECFHFFCFFPFIPVPLSSLSVSFISSTISSIDLLSPFLWETTQNDTQWLTCRDNPTKSISHIRISRNNTRFGFNR